MSTGRDKTSGKRRAGQTVIETVFMLLFLLLIFFLITEFARAWYLSNSLNNAVRVAARLAVVTPAIGDDGGTCSPGLPNAILNAVCISPGVPNGTLVNLTVEGGGPAAAGDTVTVGATANFTAIVPLVNSLTPENVHSEASMRHE
jgi:Flp pilus assembly protein TadG